jgi:selenocysteine-specific elongation factor
VGGPVRAARRDASAQRTIGGGRVLDPFPPQRRGRTPARAAALAALGHDDPAEALEALLQAARAGFDLDSLVAARNLGDAEAGALAAACVVVEVAPRRRAAFSRQRWAKLQASLREALGAHHAQHPQEWGATAEELAAALPAPLRPAAPAALQSLAEAGAIQRTGQLLHLPGREVRLGDADAVLWDDVRAARAGAGADPLRVSFLAKRLASDETELRPLLDKLGRIGWLCRVSPAYFVLPETAAGLADAARRVAAEHPDGLLPVRRFREATGISRHATMPMLKYFDRIGLTRRVPEGRMLG